MRLSPEDSVGCRLPWRLAEIGITTPLQLRDADPMMVRRRFIMVLQRTVIELQGRPCSDIEQDSRTVRRSARPAVSGVM